MSGHRSAVNVGHAEHLADVSPAVARVKDTGRPPANGGLGDALRMPVKNDGDRAVEHHRGMVKGTMIRALMDWDNAIELGCGEKSIARYHREYILAAAAFAGTILTTEEIERAKVKQVCIPIEDKPALTVERGARILTYLLSRDLRQFRDKTPDKKQPVAAAPSKPRCNPNARNMVDANIKRFAGKLDGNPINVGFGCSIVRRGNEAQLQERHAGSIVVGVSLLPDEPIRLVYKPHEIDDFLAHVPEAAPLVPFGSTPSARTGTLQTVSSFAK